jgi:hypothetical protein
MEVSGQPHAPTTVPPGKQPVVSTEQKAAWTLQPVLDTGEEKGLLLMWGF